MFNLYTAWENHVLDENRPSFCNRFYSLPCCCCELRTIQSKASLFTCGVVSQSKQQTNADLTFLSNKRCALTIWILFKQMLRAFSCSILGGLGCHVDRKVRRLGSIHSALASTRSVPSLNYESRQMLHFERAAYIHSLLHTRSADWKKIYEWKRDHRQNTTKTKVRASKNFTIGFGKC